MQEGGQQMPERAQMFEGKRIAFVSTRIAGTDGVSLEIAKWARVLEGLGIECRYVAGECDRPAADSAVIEGAHFQHDEIADIGVRAFRPGPRPPALTEDIERWARRLRGHLREALGDLGADAVIVENALTIPMHIPLGLALVQVLQETRLGCIAHHHDFHWERARFQSSCVEDYLRYAFPPALGSIQHVTINRVAAEEFARRTGLHCRVVPNVMDFGHPPSPPDAYAQELRRALGIGEGDLLILQPTRVVARKGIEHAVELARRLKDRGARLVITHRAGDEGASYAHFLGLFSDLMGVDLVYATPWIAERRGTGADGRPLFTLEDAYMAADLVTYPSENEGFGNAFLEAVYYRQPVVCKRYPIFRSDIEPCGFRVITFDDYLTQGTLEAVEGLFNRPGRRQSMVEHNYQVAERCFSYQVLEEELRPMLRRAFFFGGRDRGGSQ